MRQETNYAARLASKGRSSFEAGGNFQIPITYARQLPIPGFAREMTPLQLEWCCQRVHPLLDESDQFATVSDDRNFGAPNAAPVINVDNWIECIDSHSADIAETLAHAREHVCAIIAPLISVIGGKKIGNASPVFPFDFAQKIFRVAIDLALRLPEPNQKKTDDQGKAKAKIEAIATPTGHVEQTYLANSTETVTHCLMRYRPAEQTMAIDSQVSREWA
jgi:hypothetical protein